MSKSLRKERLKAISVVLVRFTNSRSPVGELWSKKNPCLKACLFNRSGDIHGDSRSSILQRASDYKGTVIQKDSKIAELQGKLATLSKDGEQAAALVF